MTSSQPPENGPRPLQPIRLFNEPPVPPAGRWHHFRAEPFRPFFILGWLISLIALAVWPLFFMGAVGFPARPHAFLMIQGFFGAFAIGFLWTALPRILEVPGPGPRWVVTGLAAVAANTVFHLAGLHLAGHLCFLLLLGLAATFGLTRFPARRDLPPPSFVLVVSGLGLGALGTILVATGEAAMAYGFAYRLGQLFLVEIFLLFLVLGVAAFLAPRLLKMPSKQSMPDGRNPTPAWKRQARFAGITGAVIILGAVLQAAGFIRTGALVVALPLTAYVFYQVPMWKNLNVKSWMADGVRIALLCSLAAPWARLVFPEARIATIHILLLGGFGLLTLIVGTRVVYGHSGYSHLFKSKLRPVGIIVGLYLGGLVVRLAGEIAPSVWVPALVVSAVMLLVAHLYWGWLALPKIFAPMEDEEETPSSAPNPSGPMSLAGFRPTMIQPR